MEEDYTKVSKKRKNDKNLKDVQTNIQKTS